MKPNTFGPAVSRERVYLVLLVLATLFPLLLLVELPANFYVDWHNHLWQIAYQADSLRRTSAWSTFLHTDSVVGLAYPLFYAGVFYKILGALAVPLSPELVVRLLAFGLLLAQGVLTRRVLREAGLSLSLSTGIAALGAWAIYPMTNLYNRGALTEYFATQLLTLSILLLAQTRHRAENGISRGIFLSALCLLGAMLSHPITAVLGGLFWAFCLFRMGFDWKSLRAALPVPAVLGLLSLAPWLYVTIGYVGRLAVSGAVKTLSFTPGEFDSWQARWTFFPFDGRPVGKALHTISTPFLDAPLHLPMLVLALLLLAALPGRRGTRLFFIGLGGALGAYSVWGHLTPSLNRILGVAQMSYRLVTYANLCFLAACLLGTVPSSSSAVFRRVPAVVAVLLFISAISVGLKLERAARVRTMSGTVVTSKPRQLPDSFYGVWDYVTFRVFPVAREAAGRQVLLREEGTTEFDLTERTLVGTNVYAFAWNRLELDGRVLRPDEMVTSPNTLAALVLPGRHTLAYRVEVPVAYRVLCWFQLAGLLGWVFLALFPDALQAVSAKLPPPVRLGIPVDAEGAGTG